MTNYCYINLEKTNYKLNLTDYKIFNLSIEKPPVEKMLEIYDKYVKYKKFKSVWPIYPEEFVAKQNDIIGYYNKNRLVAWSMMYKINAQVLEAIQFAWDYEDYKLGVGTFATLSEIKWAIDNGYEKYYLSYAYEKSSLYKAKYEGFECWTGREWSQDTELFECLCKNDSKIESLKDLNDYQEVYFKLMA